jgi:hypothetical protein
MRPLVINSIGYNPAPAVRRWKAQLLDADTEGLRQPFLSALTRTSSTYLPLAKRSDADAGACGDCSLSEGRWNIGPAFEADGAHLIGHSVVGGHRLSVGPSSAATSAFKRCTTLEIRGCAPYVHRFLVANGVGQVPPQGLALASGNEVQSEPRKD